MSIAVVGLGKIGSAVVPHLLQLGEEVKVWNRSRAAVERIAALGATPSSDIREALSADIVFSVLFDDAAAQEIFTPDVLSHGTKGKTLHICLSTISPKLADDFARSHALEGVGYLSAPLFGRPEAVQKKAAEICVAGPRDWIEKARPYLESFGRIWPIGDEPSQANVAKLCGNFLIGAAIQSMAEAVAILSAANANANVLMSMLTETLFASPVYRNYAPSVTGLQPLARMGIALPRKDMELLSTVAALADCPASFLDALRERLARADAIGLGAEDWSGALGKLARAGRRSAA